MSLTNFALVANHPTPAAGSAGARQLKRFAWLALVAGLMMLTTWSRGATLKAEYRFNGTLASSIAGAPDLVSVDPLNQNYYTNEVVNGLSQQVFTWSGVASPVNQQAGLTLNPAGLISSNNYSVQVICKLTDRASAWRRLIDVSNRTSDNGFYVDPGNHLAVYPIISSLTPYTNNVYEDILLTVGGGVVSAYLNGTRQFIGSSTLMDIPSTTNLMIFFVDNNLAGGQGEFSNGSIALLRIYEGVLNLNAPTLSVELSATNSVVLTWPSPSTGFVLQKNSDVSTTNWTANAAIPSDNGTIKTVVVAPPAGKMFYRLYQP